jgi:hypothetical protein
MGIFSVFRCMGWPNFSAVQTAWRSAQSGANPSPPKFPANREFNREFAVFWTSKTAPLVSKQHILLTLLK